MSPIVNVIDFYTGSGDVGDLVIHSSSKSENIKELIDSQQKWSFEVRGSDGNYRARRTISSPDLEKFRHQGNTKTLHEWELLVYQLLFNELPGKLKQSTILSSFLSDEGNVVLEINLVLMNSIKKTLGRIELETINMDTIDDDAETYEDLFQLFEWTRLLKVDRDNAKAGSDKMEEYKTKLEEQLSNSLKSQEEIVAQLKKKELHRMKVFTKILTDFQEFNRRILNGEDIPREDHFNIEQIRHAIQEVQEDEKPVVKKRKTGPVKKEKKVKVETPKKSKPKASLKRTTIKEKTEDEPDAEEATDEKDEDITSQKRELTEAYDTPKAVKAKSIPSERFAFSTGVVKDEEDEDQEVPENNNTETAGDTDGDEVEDDEYDDEDDEVQDNDELEKESDQDTDENGFQDDINQDWTDSGEE